MPGIIEFPTLVQGDERGRNSILQFPRSPARAECVAQAETERKFRLGGPRGLLPWESGKEVTSPPPPPYYVGK